MKPNIILLSIDCLRQDHLGCYGYKRDTTPNIDKIAKEGTIFNQAITGGTFTIPSLSAILASRIFKYNALDQISSMVEMSKDPLFEFVVFPKLLKSKNYKTAFFGPYITSSLQSFKRNFDFFSKCPIYSSKNSLLTITNILSNHSGRFKKIKKILSKILANRIISNIFKKLLALCNNGNEKADILTNKAIKWFNRNKKDPFFVWLHYFDAHIPYTLSQPFNKIFINDGIYKTGDIDYYISQYDGAIRFIDEQIGRLVGYLQKEGLYENTLFIITADHGICLGENNLYFTNDTLPLDVTIRVPLIMKYNQLFESKMIDQQVQTIDIGATILDILSINKPETMQGKSLLLSMQGTTSSHTSYAFIGGDAVSAVRGDGYKLIRVNHDKIKYLLFNLRNDPKELLNLADSQKDILEPLKEKLENWLKENSYEYGKSTDNFNEPALGLLKEHLKSLGYMQ